VLLLFANDFVTMSLATDRVEASPTPERWNVHKLGLTGLWLALVWVAFGVAALLLGRHFLDLGLPQLQTLCFLVLVFTGQGTIYAIRARRRLFGLRPSAWLAGSSLWAIGVTSLLAAQGWWMAPLPLSTIGELALAVTLAVLALGGARRPRPKR
jgi:H+-transporting ATPase